MEVCLAHKPREILVNQFVNSFTGDRIIKLLRVSVHLYASVNSRAQCLTQYSVLFYKCQPLTVKILSQVHLIAESVAVQCLGVCWHNLPGNNGLMCPYICIEWKKHSPKSAVLYARWMPVGHHQFLSVRVRTPLSV